MADSIYEKRGPGKPIHKDIKNAEEGTMDDEQFEFLRAVQKFKKAHNKTFLTATDHLLILKSLGYKKEEA